MLTSIVEYLGDLRCKSTHLRSGTEIITDAPVDNKGKGDYFSPTDLVATALANCMLTIMGIISQERNIDISNSKAEVEKIMSLHKPRKIEEIKITITLPKKISLYNRKLLEKAAIKCPVALSINENIKKSIVFKYIL